MRPIDARVLVLVLMPVALGCTKGRGARSETPAPASRETASKERIAEKASSIRGRLGELLACLHLADARVRIAARRGDVLEVTFDVEEATIVKRQFPCPGEEGAPSYLIDSATLPRPTGFVLRLQVERTVFEHADARHWENPCGHDYGDSFGSLESETGTTIEVVRMLPKPHGRPPFVAAMLLRGSSESKTLIEDVRNAVFGAGAVTCVR
jgi:hypothetical protein